MLLSELFALYEMPQFKDKEMAGGQVDWKDVGVETEFMSEETLQREWKLLKIINGSNVRVYINNEHSAATIGEYGVRADQSQKPGLRCFVTATFHENQMLADTFKPQLKGALQIDVVEANRAASKGRGYGTALYFALVDAGLSIISDNTQYRGGKALWIKMAQSLRPGYQINIIENGTVKLDDQGQPFQWNGSNLPENELWSADTSKSYTLFVLRKA